MRYPFENGGDDTGHYAATEKTPQGRTRLLRSADELKDQTYYLSSCTETQLSRVSLPPSSLLLRSTMNTC